MKTVNFKDENKMNETSIEENFSSSSSKLARFDEVAVYNELADQAVSKIHLLQQINSQLSQIEVMNARRKFLLKQVSEIIIKD